MVFTVDRLEVELFHLIRWYLHALEIELFFSDKAEFRSFRA